MIDRSWPTTKSRLNCNNHRVKICTTTITARARRGCRQPRRLHQPQESSCMMKQHSSKCRSSIKRGRSNCMKSLSNSRRREEATSKCTRTRTSRCSCRCSNSRCSGNSSCSNSNSSSRTICVEGQGIIRGNTSHPSVKWITRRWTRWTKACRICTTKE